MVIPFKKLWPLLLSLSIHPLHSADLGYLSVFGQVAWSEAAYDSTRTPEDSQDTIEADILYTYDKNRFSFLAEYYLSDDNSELERLELALRLNTWTSIKAGLLHNPAEYWLSEYHNGSYSQTSITRPFESLIGFSGGVTNTRLSGLQWLNEFTLPNDSTLSFDYTVAASPKLSASEPKVNLNDYFGADNDFMLSVFRLRFKPLVFNDSSIGISFSDGDIGIEQDAVQQLFGPLSSFFDDAFIDQTTLNLYANIEYGPWRLIASRLNQKLEVAGIDLSSITFIRTEGSVEYKLNYFHLERTLAEQFLLFSRYEKANPKGDISGITQLFSTAFNFDLNYEKTLIGGRWDFAKNQALSFQYTDHSTPTERQNMIHLSWSFVWQTGL